MAKAKYVEGAFYWARKTWGDDLEPFIVCCEDPYGRGKFRQFDGHWGSDDAYKILAGPLTYQAPMKSLKEGYVRKGGRNTVFPTERPAPPAPMRK